jgi:hypothetical protein
MMAEQTKTVFAVFYVYILFREDGRPFYVGKGSNGRSLEHEREARRGVGRRFSIIRKMQALGLDLPKIKLHQGLTEAVAHPTRLRSLRRTAATRTVVRQRDGWRGWVPRPTSSMQSSPSSGLQGAYSRPPEPGPRAGSSGDVMPGQVVPEAVPVFTRQDGSGIAFVAGRRVIASPNSDRILRVVN